ncbi:hypothetical protein D3C85_943250 [compost metagenome]
MNVSSKPESPLFIIGVTTNIRPQYKFRCGRYIFKTNVIVAIIITAINIRIHTYFISSTRPRWRVRELCGNPTSLTPSIRLRSKLYTAFCVHRGLNSATGDYCKHHTCYKHFKNIHALTPCLHLYLRDTKGLPLSWSKQRMHQSISTTHNTRSQKRDSSLMSITALINQ